MSGFSERWVRLIFYFWQSTFTYALISIMWGRCRILAVSMATAPPTTPCRVSFIVKDGASNVGPSERPWNDHARGHLPAYAPGPRVIDEDHWLNWSCSSPEEMGAGRRTTAAVKMCNVSRWFQFGISLPREKVFWRFFSRHCEKNYMLHWFVV